MAGADAVHLAAMYAVRAQLLVGLGAVKRAVIEMSAAKFLDPENAELKKQDAALQEKLKDTVA